MLISMRVFKTPRFDSIARKEGISNEQLLQAIREIEAGSYYANLGGGVYKQRVARNGQGKSGGFRTIVLVKHKERAFFVYMFAKNDMANISNKELRKFKLDAKRLLRLNEWKLPQVIETEGLIEISEGGRI